MNVRKFIVLATLNATLGLISCQVIADEDTSAVVSAQQQEVWNQHVVELLKIGRDATEKNALSQAEQHYADAASILSAPELEHAMAITLFSAGQYAEAAKHLETQLQHSSQTDSAAAMLYCRCCLHSGGRSLSSVVNFAKSTIDSMQKKPMLTATDTRLLQLIGSVVAVVSELDRPPARTVKQLATLDRNIRKNRNTQVLRGYLTGYDGVSELLVSNAGALSGRALDEKTVREDKLQEIADEKNQIAAKRDALAAQRKTSALAVQKQVDAIDKLIIPQMAGAQRGFERHHILGLQIVQLQAAMQSSNITQIERLQLLKNQEQCVAEKQYIEKQLTPFVNYVTERQRLAEQYKALAGQQLKANAALAGLENMLDNQQQNLAERVEAGNRGKLSDRDAIAIVLPIDLIASTTNVATALNLNIP